MIFAFKSLIFVFLISFTFNPFASASSCADGQHWVRAYHRRAYTKTDGTFVSATAVKAHCQGDPPGYSFLKDRFKGGYPPLWPHHKEKSTSWTEEERERIIEALSVLPSELWDSSIKGIFRLAQSDDFPNPSSWGPKTIVLYDTAFDEGRNLSRIMTHELAHQIYEGIYTTNDGSDFRRVAGWKFTDKGDGDFYLEPTRNGYVTEHAKESDKEDFATGVEYFLFDRDKLKSISPSVYEWLHRHFGDNFRVGR